MVDQYDVCTIMDQCDDGDWVRYEDHVTEVERLTAELAEARVALADERAAHHDVVGIYEQARRNAGALRDERDEALEQVGKVIECVTIERRARDAAETELTAAREALGEAWLSGGTSLAEGIRRKTAALEASHD